MSSNNLFSQCDFHIHTHLSECARREMRLPAILDVCARRGIKYLGITDHVSLSTDPDLLDAASRELAELDKPMNVYLGCEADILAVGKHVVTDQMKSTLDFIAVAANHFHVTCVSQPQDSTPWAFAQHCLDMFAYACSLEFVDVIVHPMCEVSGECDPASFDLLSDDDMMMPLAQAKRNRIAMEISPRALSPGDKRFRLRFYRLCKRVGLKFAFGSDAHSLQQAGQTRILADLADKIGITDGDVWLPDGGKCK